MCIIAGGRNKFINVSYDQDFATVNCTFLTNWSHVTSGEFIAYNRAEAKYYTCSIAYGINKSQVTTNITMDSLTKLILLFFTFKLMLYQINIEASLSLQAVITTPYMLMGLLLDTV